MFSKLHLIVLSMVISTSFLGVIQRVEAFEMKHNLGAGIGVPFGIVGVSYGLEMNVTDSFAIIPTIATGTSVVAGATDEVGLRLLIGDKNARIRFGASYWSGTNTLIKTGSSTYESMKGDSAGINLRIQLGSKRNHTIEVYMLRAITPDDDEVFQKYGVSRENESGVLFGVGYVHRF